MNNFIQVKKSLHGLIATNIERVNDTKWEITTMKRSNEALASIAQKCEASDDGTTVVYTPHQDESFVLCESTPGRVTEELVREQHAKALTLMYEHAGIAEASQSQGIQVGQIIFTFGLEEENRRVVYNIEKMDVRTHYYTVTIDGTLQLRTDTRIEPIDKKFGIGTYYKPGDFYKGSEDDLANLVLEAMEKKEKDDMALALHQKNIKEERLAAIEKGKELVQMPDGVTHVIAAFFNEDESDGMSDYFGSRTEKTVILDWSRSTRDSFPEMRKAALNFEETKFLHDADKEFEHREKYAMGNGNYLGKYWDSTGWKVQRVRIGSYGVSMDEIYIAAANGLYFCNTASPSSETVEVAGFDLAETMHSKKGIKLFVASIKGRVNKDEYYRLLEIAKSHGGYYSGYNRDGAIPGFQFKTIENRSQFIEAAK